MGKITKIILMLVLAAAAGLYLGFRNRDLEVQVYGPDGGTSPASFIISAGQLDAGDWQKQAQSLPGYVSRASAITAYLLMFVVIVWGVGMTMGFIYAIANPVEAWVIHKYLSMAFGLTVLIHMFSLLGDRYINFKIWHLLIPFYASYKPLYLSLGIIGFYLLLAIILSSLLIRLKSPRFWRAVHYLVYVLFIFSLIHGIFLGTDSKTSAMRAVYWITGAAFILLLAWRLRWFYKNKV